MKRVVTALEALGVTAKLHKEGRTVVAATLSGAVPTMKVTSRYPYCCKRLTPADLLRTEALRDLACEALGEGEKRRRQKQGLPTTARSEDPDVRTCGCCFRDIKATADDRRGRNPSPGHRADRFTLTVDHGYKVDGGGWSYGMGACRHRNGTRWSFRSGGCIGTGLLPLEESVEGPELLLSSALHHSVSLVRAIRRYEEALAVFKASPDGPWPTMPEAFRTVKVQGEWVRGANGVRGHHARLDVGPEDYRWLRAVEGAKRSAVSELRNLWSAHFGSVPWLRAVVREWAPQAADVVPCKGAPLVTVLEADYAGKPEEATR